MSEIDATVAPIKMHVGECTNCRQSKLVGPLHSENGGPAVCIRCGMDWHVEHGRRRKMGRIVIKAMKAFFDAGGAWDAINRLKLAAGGMNLYAGEADTIGADVRDISLELLEDAIRLTHPDRHPPERQETAKRVTQELLAFKPYAFPAPKPKEVPKPRDASAKAPPVTPKDPLQGPFRLEYPCEVCADQTPFYYCNACRAEWERRRQADRAREREKRRAAYQRRKMRRQWNTKPTPCATCGEPFKGKRKDAKHCSAACRQRSHRGRVTDKRPVPVSAVCSRNGGTP